MMHLVWCMEVNMEAMSSGPRKVDDTDLSATGGRPEKRPRVLTNREEIEDLIASQGKEMAERMQISVDELRASMFRGGMLVTVFDELPPVLEVPPVLRSALAALISDNRFEQYHAIANLGRLVKDHPEHKDFVLRLMGTLYSYTPNFPKEHETFHEYVSQAIEMIDPTILGEEYERLKTMGGTSSLKFRNKKWEFFDCARLTFKQYGEKPFGLSDAILLRDMPPWTLLKDRKVQWGLGLSPRRRTQTPLNLLSFSLSYLDFVGYASA